MTSYLFIHRQLFLFLFLVVMADTDLMSQIEESQSSSGILLKLKQDFYNKFDNSISSLDPIQLLSLIQVYENELDKALNTIERTDYLEEKLNIANRYWEYRDFEGALSAYEKIATLEPNSRYAAKAFMMRGWIRYGNLRDPKLAIVELEKSAEILEALRNVPVGEVHDYQVNEIAGQVLSYYFSKENDIRKKYDSFNQEFQEFQKKLRKEDNLKVEHWIVVYRVCQQTLLLEAHHYEKQGQNKKVATVKEELEKTWEEKRNKGVEGDFEVVVPTTFSIQVAEKIMSFRNKFWPDSKDEEDEEDESSKKVDSRTKTKGQG